MKINKGGDSINDFAISPNGKYLINGGDDNTLRIWTT